MEELKIIKILCPDICRHTAFPVAVHALAVFIATQFQSADIYFRGFVFFMTQILLDYIDSTRPCMGGKKSFDPNTFITVSRYGISFSQLSLQMLHYARFVHVFIDRDSKKLAIQECKKDASTIELVHENKSDSPSVRWGNRKLLRIVKELSGKDINTSGIRFTGEFHEAEKLIIFNLKGEEEHEVR